MGVDDVPGYVIPFMEIPEGYVDIKIGNDPHAILVDDCQYETAIANTPIGLVPVLTFRFGNSQGMKVAPLVLMLGHDYMQEFKENLVKAINHAIQKAKKHGI